MCMKNVNAIADIDALDEFGKIISIIDNTNFNKIIKLNATKKLLISFSCSIINGTDKCFTKYQKLYFQLRITNKQGKTVPKAILNEYYLDLKDSNLHYETDLVDFIYKKDIFMSDLMTENIEPNNEYYLNILVKTQQDLYNDENWTIQSVIPFRFE